MRHELNQGEDRQIGSSQRKRQNGVDKETGVKLTLRQAMREIEVVGVCVGKGEFAEIQEKKRQIK